MSKNWRGDILTWCKVVVKKINWEDVALVCLTLLIALYIMFIGD